MLDIQKECYKAFKADEHEWLQGKFIYVTVNSTIQRLNEVSDHWNLWHRDSTIAETTDNKGRIAYLATKDVELEIPSLGTRTGSGADCALDCDKAVKTAQAYAFRKAANQFGVAHYLLMNPEKESDLVKHLLNSDQDDPEDMKQAIVMLMDIRKVEVSAANLMKEFNVTEDQLRNDVEIFAKILRQENRI